MKKFICREMGGPCDAEISGNTPEEVMNNGVAHVMAAQDETHGKIAEQMKNSTDEEKKQWNDWFMTIWNNKPEAQR